MSTRSLVTRILAILGSVLIWFPIVAPLLLAMFALVQRGRFMLDYLMPAELFFVALAGGVLLITAAARARMYRRLIVAGFVGAVVLLGVCLLIAQVSGLASGAIEPQGIWWALTFSGLMLYTAGLVVTGVGGILLLRNLFKPLRSTAPLA